MHQLAWYYKILFIPLALAVIVLLSLVFLVIWHWYIDFQEPKPTSNYYRRWPVLRRRSL